MTGSLTPLGFVWQLWRSLWSHLQLNSRVGGGAMRVAQVNYGWNPIESAPLDEDVTLQVTDGRGGPYTLPGPCRLTASGWVSSGKGTPLAVTPEKWKPYFPARSCRPR
jgi:hypothetical protein